MKVQSLSFNDPDYPAHLRELHDAPQRLYYCGDLSVLKGFCLGIVGTRRCSAYGEHQAFTFAKSLSEKGLCIVSGLAFGVDAAAHKGALEGKGPTVAVLAQALPNVSPARHQNLASAIVAAGGLLISEKAPQSPSYKSDYLFRNRLISGLSRGILVVEAPARSGALNTANHALEQNREVMALPGRLTDSGSEGCHRLLRAGARLVRSPQDVMEDLGLEWEVQTKQQLSIRQKLLYDFILQEPKNSAELGEQFGEDLPGLYTTLGELELLGLVKQTQERRFVAL